MKPDPRLTFLCYVCWYAVLWIQHPIMLVCLLFLQCAVFIAVGGLHSIFWRVVRMVALAAGILSGLAYLFAYETPASLGAMWGKWGSVVLATVIVATLMSLRDLFVALRWCRVPRNFAFPLGIALKFLPVVIDETRRCILSLRARGLTSGGGFRAIILIPRLAIDLWIPVLANVLERAQRTWFSMELRGFWDTLHAPSNSAPRSIISDVLILVWAVIPVCVLFIARLA